jgi:hypothetical protein
MAGRPSKYKEEYAEVAKKLSMLGHTDKELARFFDTTEQTINSWKQTYPEFLESLKEGKDIADAKVAESLFKRATGYDHPETKFFVVNTGDYQQRVEQIEVVKHYPPDPTSMIFWLKNRQPKTWRDKVDHEGASPDINITVSGIDPPKGE